MCAVSAVVDTWTNPHSPNYIQSWPNIKPDTAADMLRVIALLEKIDKTLGALECKVAEPEKAKVKRTLRKRAKGK